MDGRRLLSAARTGDSRSMEQLDLHNNPAVLRVTTQQGNSCLHISSIHGHEGFCKDVLALDQSQELLSAVNEDGETPCLPPSQGAMTLLLLFYSAAAVVTG
ncbi:unnamed protein product [Urochloa humidicola]